MTLVVITTPGDATANSYASLADAEAYALTLPVANEWATSTEAQKNAALVQATRMLDTLVWQGYVTNWGTQALRWPRSSVILRDIQTVPTVFGMVYQYNVPNNVIPAKIRDACCEFAIRLVADDRAADAGGLAPETLKIGSLELGKLKRVPFPPSVLELVREYLANAGGPQMVRS